MLNSEFDSYVSLLSAAGIAGTHKELADRLSREMLLSGYNVTKCFLDHPDKLRPWIFDRALISFYQTTDAFVFELLTWHLSPARQKWRTEFGSYIGTNNITSVLLFGDGIGIDSVSIKRRFPNVAVDRVEYQGPSDNIARHIVKSEGLSIGFYSPLDTISRQYDLVICLEVLEHSPDPEDVLKALRRYMGTNGVLALSESFGAIEPLRPTHLLTNLKHAGRLDKLTSKVGLSYVGTLIDRIHLFSAMKKATLPSLLRFIFIQRLARVLILRKVKKSSRVTRDEVSAYINASRFHL